MLTRQTANPNRLETMAEKAQSGNDSASSGEVYMPAKRINDQKVKNGSRRKRGRPKKHIVERNDSHIGDEIPQTGDFHLSGIDLMVPPYPCTKQRRNGVAKQNAMLRNTEKTAVLEGQADATQFQVVSNPVDSHEIDHMIIDEASVPDDNRTLSMCSDIQPLIGSDDSRTLPVDKQDGNRTPLDQGNTMRASPLQTTDDSNIPDLNQCANLIDKIVSTDSMDLIDKIVSTDSIENEETVPFVKHSSVWKSLCASEAYVKMKHKPHFHPLEEQEEILREGIAIGLVFNFNNLVDATSKLQSSSDVTVIERMLKTLDMFKPHGFDVEQIEADLAELISLKKQVDEDLQKKYEEMESKISKNVEEGKLGHEKISQLRQKIREIEKELKEAELNEENREKDLSVWRSEQAEVAEGIQSANAKFEKIVGSYK